VSDKSQECVLVVPTAVFQAVGVFQGFEPRLADYWPRLFDPTVLSFRPRGEVEMDPGFKQLVPYVVLKCQDQVFHYTRGRAGAEARLRALRSLGVGGHISATDGSQGEGAYRAGLLREIAEEVHLETTYVERCLGLLNDDRTPVGQVHLGIVHVFELAEPKARRRESALARAGFAPLSELRRQRDEFESWSQIVLEVLTD